MQTIQPLNEFLEQYQDALTELRACKDRLLELEYPERGNRITIGDHAGISNHPEEYAIIKDQLERKIYYLEKSLPHKKKQIERFLNRIKPRQARVLRKKYIDGLDNRQLASWMKIQYKSALAVIRLALEHAQLEYDKITQEQKNTPE
jgi:hypothetical protein